LRHQRRAFAFGTDAFQILNFSYSGRQMALRKKESPGVLSIYSAKVSKCLREALRGSLISQRQ
jgi:hypothetical protein